MTASPTRPRIALCLIVKDGAHTLDRLLNSVEGCFDEIHITDTGSQDRTCELVQKSGATLHHFTWCDDFAAARNASFAPATTDYVMWMDADDELKDAAHFREWRDSEMAKAPFWTCPYHTQIRDGKPVRTLVRERVWKRSLGLKWRSFIHETVYPEVGKEQSFPSAHCTTWSIWHQPAAADPDPERNLRLLLAQQDCLSPRLRYHLGNEFLKHERPQEAVAEFKRALGTPGTSDNPRQSSESPRVWEPT
jgi:hypothetical protein